MNEEAAELSYEEFAEARESYRRQATRGMAGSGTGSASRSEESGSFVLYSPGSKGIFAVFEDSEHLGCFYLYDAMQKKILKSADIYDRTHVGVDEDVVDIGWAEDGSACGLAVWGEFRAFLGVSNDLQLRKPVMDTEERGIPAQDWPAGFERYLEKKID
ncbi:MAG: hypothetical protein WAJ96_01850 [Candidatus Acidiferrum sp.]